MHTSDHSEVKDMIQVGEVLKIIKSTAVSHGSTDTRVAVLMEINQGRSVKMIFCTV